MGFIVFVLLALFLGCLLVALLTFAFVWYESANQEPALVAGRFAPANLLLALQLLLLESGLLWLSLLLHPWGWRSPRELRTDSEGGPPVILLHGLFQSRACWFWTRRQLRQFGYRNVFPIALPPWEDLETLTERVSTSVDQLRHRLGVEQVVLVGHSMGGMVARNFLQLRGGAGKVAGCVLLGTPHHGSRLAPFALSPLGEQVMPGAEFLQRLAAAPLPATVPITNILSRQDNIILPWRSARLEGVDNIELEGLGHTALLYHPLAFQALLQGLRAIPEAHP